MGNNQKAKSVINMVHRIQNRNPGYSDFTSASSVNHLIFQTMLDQLHMELMH